MSASSYLEGVVLGTSNDASAKLIRALLWPWSLIYRAGLAIYLSIYNLGLRKRHKLSMPVISVGNLTFGGTGKTPAVQTICRMLLARGMKVVVLSRGHGGSAKGSVIVSDGESILTDSATAGDEPILLAKSLPGVPVIVGKDRRISGEIACAKFSPDVIFLDDGLQYWQLFRNLDIVILDAARPFGSGRVMPMGDLREPASGLGRAGIVLLANSAGADESICNRISKLAPNAQIYRCNHSTMAFRRVGDDSQLDLEWIRGKKILAFCGIGKPASFFLMLEDLGAKVEASIAFFDHHDYTNEEISRLEDQAKTLGVDAVVTTEKDIARLGKRASISNLHTLIVELKLDNVIQFEQQIINTIKTKD